MTVVWQTMRDLFGATWSSQFGRTPTPAWRALLRDLSAEEVRAGLRAVAEAGSNFPPSGPEFRALCRPTAPKRTREQRAFYALVDESERHQALPSPEALAASGGTVGRRWWAFWVLEGLRPMPSGVTMDDIAEALEGANVEAMRAEAAAITSAILSEPGQGPVPALEAVKVDRWAGP